MGNAPVEYSFFPGPVSTAFGLAQEKLREMRFAQRLAAREPGLFKAEAEHQEVIRNRLGWLDSYVGMKAAAPELEELAKEVADAGLDQIVLIGMGGSSLCPEVFGSIFGLPEHLNTYVVLDSTSPDAVEAVVQLTDPRRTLFIVASKSGTTVETRSHADFFFARQKEHAATPGKHFIAITDAGSVLQSWANEEHFRRVFINPSDIGGRFSALSYFGLVPAALLGIDLTTLLGVAEFAAGAEAGGGPAQKMGAFLYACAQAGRDKITFIASPQTSPIVPWVEQLLAESTGKEGKGVFPIEDEPPGSLDTYGPDRLFVVMRFATEDDPELTNAIHELGGAGFPVAELVISEPNCLGAVFLQWEWTTSAVGALLGVNPFDEPNVMESKDITSKLLYDFAQEGEFARRPEIAGDERFLIFAPNPDDYAGMDISQILQKWVKGIQPGDYAALLAYLAADDEFEESLARIRTALRDKLHIATLRGWGPRFLHSIGQLYKGGPQRGHFLVITHQSEHDIAIPGRPYTFGQLITGQALGDAEALAKRSRPVLHIELRGEVFQALTDLADQVVKAVNTATT